MNNIPNGTRVECLDELGQPHFGLVITQTADMAGNVTGCRVKLDEGNFIDYPLGSGAVQALEHHARVWIEEEQA